MSFRLPVGIACKIAFADVTAAPDASQAVAVKAHHHATMCVEVGKQLCQAACKLCNIGQHCTHAAIQALHYSQQKCRRVYW